MNAQIVEMKGRDIVIAYHPERGDPRPGDALVVQERGVNGRSGRGIVVQVIGYDSAGYPGEREALFAELLESAIAEKHEVVRGEPAMVDLKEIKLARCKIRKTYAANNWFDWDGRIPTRNVVVREATAQEILDHVIMREPTHPLVLANYRGQELQFDATRLDKVNALVGVKGTGKSHTGKLLLHGLTLLGAPCWVFDINREFIDLPGADTIRVGENCRLCLHEVGFPFLMAVIDDMGTMTQNSLAAFESEAPRFIEQEVARNGFATVQYLLDRASQGAFHTNIMVNEAIEGRLRMVLQTGIFADNPTEEPLTDRFRRVTRAGGFCAFDLAELRPRRLAALTRGLNRRLEAICEEERRAGSQNYPFVFFEEAHFYSAADELLNLITRGRHLGLTTFFITNTPGQLPEPIFRQLDNLIVTGLTHSSDLRTVGRCSLSDEDTLESLAVTLGQTQALIVGRITGNFPLVATINNLPGNFPTTGETRSFWPTIPPTA